MRYTFLGTLNFRPISNVLNILRWKTPNPCKVTPASESQHFLSSLFIINSAAKLICYNILHKQYINIKMYNIFTAKKKSLNLEDLKIKSSKQKHYLQRYHSKIRPSLIDNYNKRINTFIRKMEQQPVQIHLDPQKKEQLSPEQKDIKQSFRFKDSYDWRSMYTPLERIQRERNVALFQEKYGDANIAFRSIGSQSEYNPLLGNQFRPRDKSKQINPPMKYTNKATYKVLKRKKNKKKTDEKQPYSLQKRQTTEDALRKNTASSMSVIEDEILTINQSNARRTDHSSEEDQEKKQKIVNIKKQKELKLHFKEIIDLETNITEPKSKKTLRGILYKCGVYRRKDRRAITQMEVDQFLQFQQKN